MLDHFQLLGIFGFQLAKVSHCMASIGPALEEKVLSGAVGLHAPPCKEQNIY